MSAGSPFRLLRHPLRLRALTVADARLITPRMKRITLCGDDLTDFVTLAPEDHVKLFFPAPGEERPVVPFLGPTGLVVPPGSPKPIARDYTPRRHDPAARTLEIDFFLHGGGVAAGWADQARPGQTIGVAGPRGSYVLSGTYDWQLLVGDETALPEIARRLDELPPTTRAFAALAVASGSEEQPLADRPHTHVTWVHRPANPNDLAARLIEAVNRFDLPFGGAGGFAWIAGEASEARAVYSHLVLERRFDRKSVRVSGHWKRGVSNHDHHEEIAV